MTANFSQEALGGTADVTAVISGTNYTVSNPSIATLSTDGLVTTVSSGTVLVSAMNDGPLGVVQLQVRLEGADSDGPANLAEFNLGTTLNHPVSDADGVEQRM